MAGASDLASLYAGEDFLGLDEFVKGLFHFVDGVACALIGVEHAAVASDGAESHLERRCEACEGVFEHKLHMEPAGQLGAVAHHEVIVVLAVGHGVDAARDQRMKLSQPLGLWIGVELGTCDGGDMRQIRGAAKDLAIVGGMNFDDAAGKDEEREFDLLEKSVRGRGSPTPDVADRE